MPARGVGYGLLRYLSGSDAGRTLRGDAPPDVLFNYLGRAETDQAGLLQLVEPVFGPARSDDANRAYLVEVNAQLRDGRLVADWRFSPTVHRRATIERVAHQFIAALVELTGGDAGVSGGAHSPSDFPLADLDQGELDDLSDLLGELD